MNGQPGSYRSGSLGRYAQPVAFRSGSLGRYAQPGTFNSGSLGRVAQPGVFNSGSLGRYAQPGTFNSGSLGCGCGPKPVSGLGSTVRQGLLAISGTGVGRALGAISFDLDLIVGTAIGAGAIWFAMGKKCSV